MKIASTIPQAIHQTFLSGAFSSSEDSVVSINQHQQIMDRLGVRQVPEGNGKQGKMEKTGYKIICGAPTALAVKGLMMMMTSLVLWSCSSPHSDHLCHGLQLRNFDDELC